jgi:hypothetical protein
MTMIKNKKMIMALSFCVGAVMLATTAFADITIKTGYDQAKDSLKFTAESIIEKAQSYTMQATVSMKDNDNLLTSNTNISKTDNVNEQSESISITENKDGKKHESSNYSDKNTWISHNSGSDIYYVTEHSGSSRYNSQERNPFKESAAKDAEKIVDALIGNLKDYVIVNDKPDGSKELSGSLSEAQIPALINAVASFGFKQSFPQGGMVNQELSIPQVTEDIFIKSVKATANINKDGLIESILASATLSGKDKDGILHEITLDALVRITDVNSTIITKPDLTGKKVEKNVQVAIESKTIPTSFLGKYKNDIVILKDDKFIKIGERFVEITEIKDTHIIGRYYEEYKAEYASENTKNDLAFDAEMKDHFYGQFNFTSSTGENQIGSINWNMQNGTINFYANQHDMKYDGNFLRVFD